MAASCIPSAQVREETHHNSFAKTERWPGALRCSGTRPRVAEYTSGVFRTRRSNCRVWSRTTTRTRNRNAEYPGHGWDAAGLVPKGTRRTAPTLEGFGRGAG